MKLEDLVQALPSKEDLASAIGLETRNATGMDTFTAFGVFGAGIILGAGLALLFAPKAGHEIRQDIAERVGEMSEHLRAQAPQSRTPANGPTA